MAPETTATDEEVLAAVRALDESGQVVTQSRGASVLLRGVTKDFGTVRAVDDVSLEIEAGEFIALLGPSGSGKTTILMAVAGFQQPTAGAVVVAGQDVTRLPPYRREIGVVFQHYALFPHKNVADNVGFPLKMRRVSRPERRRLVREALALVKLDGYESRLPRELSGGQQQRVALARAVVYRPPVLLMDEPLGALDKKLREHMQLELKQIQRRLGTTVVYVTHDQDEALTMADRIAVIHNGQVEQLGTPRELYERPSTEFVADFVGETNFVQGTLEALGPDAATVAIGPARVMASVDPAPNQLPIGASVRLVVRPERVQLLATRPETHSVSGVVEEVLYAGSSLLYIVRVRHLKARIRVRVPTTYGTRCWSPGDHVHLTWRAQDARIYA